MNKNNDLLQLTSFQRFVEDSQPINHHLPREKRREALGKLLFQFRALEEEAILNTGVGKSDSHVPQYRQKASEPTLLQLFKETYGEI
jgi:hypothetical protein